MYFENPFTILAVSNMFILIIRQYIPFTYTMCNDIYHGFIYIWILDVMNREWI